MFIRLSRYVILGMIISLIVFLVTQNNKDKVKIDTIMLIGVISAVIIFAISFRIEFFENTDAPETPPPMDTIRTDGPKNVKEGVAKPQSSNNGVLINERAKIRQMAYEMIQSMDKEGTEDDAELMAKVEEAIKAELGASRLPKTKMAEKIAERVMNPKLNEEIPVQTQPKENVLSMQYENAIEEVIKEKIREQLYSDEVIQRQKESDYVIQPVSSWSLPLEKRKYKCIPREEKEVCDCAPGQGTGFWEGSFLKLRGAKDLPPQPSKEVEI